MGVDGGGKTLSVKVAGNGEEVKVENLRLGSAAKDLLPICTKTNLATRVLQKLTGSSSPSSCVIDAGKVKTFDKYEYDYTLNDCEHIIFTEASPRPRVTVSAKETPQKQTVIMLVDGHKYEIEIKKESRYSRDNKAIIKVNGEVKQWRSIQQQLQQQQPLQQQQQRLTFDQHSHNVYDDSDSSVTCYADGVYSITSRKYGVTVYADGTRMEVKGEICFSKEMIRNCVRSFPKEIKSRQVEFTCRSGAQAEILKRRVESGSLVEELKGYPTSYSQIVYQPEQC